jgi:hypothetical protein
MQQKTAQVRKFESHIKDLAGTVIDINYIIQVIFIRVPCHSSLIQLQYKLYCIGSWNLTMKKR